MVFTVVQVIFKVLRQWVTAIAILVVMVAIAACSYIRLEGDTLVNQEVNFENPLQIPPLLEYTEHHGERVFADLLLQPGQTEFFAGVKTDTWGINGTYLGPTIRAHTGSNIRLRVKNTLDEITTIHWHGAHVPASMDGGPHQVIEPDEVWDVEFPVNQEAATLWYHPHALHTTGPHVYNGLAGMFIIDDDNSDSLNIPKTYGIDDVPVIVQDRLFDHDGQFIYNRINDVSIVDGGMLGDAILVNGTYAPYIEVPQTFIRLRLLNASNARRFNFGFSDNRAFMQIATDGGFLESPVDLTRLLLAPGERAEIIVDMHNSEEVTLMSYAVTDDENLFIDLGEAIIGEKKDEGQVFKILELRPQPANAASTVEAVELPENLNTIERWQESEATRTRNFTLRSHAHTHTINRAAMDHNRIDQVVTKGDVEIWEIHNDSSTYHPFHIHLVQFLILDRDGNLPEAHEQGWKDTVNIGTRESVRVMMQFTDHTDSNLPYMYHCHILEHEDMGMMGQFVVVDRETEDEDVHIQSSLSDVTQEHRH